MPLTKLHPRDVQRIDWTVRTVEGAPIVHPNETRKRRGILATPFRRANVEGYGPDNAYYVGHLIDASGEPIGEEIELHIQRGVPDGETDVRYFWPRLRAKVNGEWHNATGLVVVPVTETDGDDTVTRWYFVMGFGPWCEMEAVLGTVPRLPKLAPPGPPVPPDGLVPTEGPFRPPGGPPAPGGDDYEDEPRGCGGGYAG